MQESEGRAMKKTLSRIMVLLLAMVMVITSALAVFADTESVQPAGQNEPAAAEITQYVITFDHGDGSGTMNQDTVTARESYNLPECDFTAPEGYEFDCWKIGDSTYPAKESVPVSADTTVTAQWKEIQTPAPEPEIFTVTFKDGYSGKELKAEKVESGSSATAPADPSRDGYTFDGWDADFTDITADLTVNAKWKEIPHTHSYGEWTVTVKPTYFKTGKKVRKCSCGETQTQTVAKLTAKNKWIKDNNKWYYFGSNGKVYSGWQKMKARGTNTVKWLYFTPTGIYWKSVSINTKNKWVYAGGYKFYFTKYKKPAGPGFNFVNSKLYHMNKLGGVMYGKFKAKDGYTYTTAKDGTINGVPYYRIRYKTFVLVDISDQTIWYYQNGKQKLKSDVVTGTKGRTPTPTGVFKVRSKLRNINLVGPTWNSHVRYWMAFKGSAYGLHDASWRTSKQFSNHKTYLKNGSHGCVNLGPSFAGKLYNSVKRGTVVIIRK